MTIPHPSDRLEQLRSLRVSYSDALADIDAQIKTVETYLEDVRRPIFSPVLDGALAHSSLRTTTSNPDSGTALSPKYRKGERSKDNRTVRSFDAAQLKPYRAVATAQDFPGFVELYLEKNGGVLLTKHFVALSVRLGFSNAEMYKDAWGVVIRRLEKIDTITHTGKGRYERVTPEPVANPPETAWPGSRETRGFALESPENV